MRRSKKVNPIQDSINRLWESQRIQSSLHDSLRNDVRELKEANKRGIPYILIGVGVMLFLVACGVGECSRMLDEGTVKIKMAEKSVSSVITSPNRMLEDQEFTSPIKTIIGPELFYANNPMRMDIGNAQQFQRIICPSGMFQFYYLAFADSKNYGDQAAYVEGLKRYGLALEAVLILKPVTPETHRMVSELTFAAEITFPTEVVKTLAIRGRQEYSNGPKRFIEALTTQIQTTAGWDWELFIDF
jgi:hypothetical protein